MTVVRAFPIVPMIPFSLIGPPFDSPPPGKVGPLQGFEKAVSRPCENCHVASIAHFMLTDLPVPSGSCSTRSPYTPRYWWAASECVASPRGWEQRPFHLPSPLVQLVPKGRVFHLVASAAVITGVLPVGTEKKNPLQAVGLTVWSGWLSAEARLPYRLNPTTFGYILNHANLGVSSGGF